MSKAFSGNIAELLLYGRILRTEEKASVEQYLQQKHAALLSCSPEARRIRWKRPCWKSR
jgi:hypothetical protein